MEGSAALPPVAAAPPLAPAAAPVAAPEVAPVAPSAPPVSFSVGVAAQDPSSAGSNPDQPSALPPTNPVSAAATPADKPTNAGVTTEQQEEQLPSGLSIMVGAGMNFGSSTLVPETKQNQYVRDPMVDWSLAISPSYSFPDNTRVSASASINQELTKADGDDAPNTLLFGDISLGVGRPIYQFANGPKINGSLSARIPTSTASRAASLITSIGAGLNSGMNFGKFGVSVGLGYRKNFHRYTHPTRQASTGRPYTTADGLVIEDVVTGIARSGGSELAGNTYFDGESNNTSMVLSGTLGASYSLTDRIGFGISYGLAKSWTYDSYPVDDLSSPYATAGRGQHDTQTGTLSANYRAFDNLSFGLGMATAGGIFRADNKSYRFPFYAFEGAESNMTTFFVNATYTESIPL